MDFIITVPGVPGVPHIIIKYLAFTFTTFVDAYTIILVGFTVKMVHKGMEFEEMYVCIFNCIRFI
mgnify:CR=1